MTTIESIALWCQARSRECRAKADRVTTTEEASVELAQALAYLEARDHVRSLPEPAVTALRDAAKAAREWSMCYQDTPEILPQTAVLEFAEELERMAICLEAKLAEPRS